MLAGIEGIEYEQSSLLMQPGDKLFLYTDGITEANNPAGEQYGKERLKAKLNSTAGLSTEAALTNIKADIERFADTEPQFDDITMLMISLK